MAVFNYYNTHTTQNYTTTIEFERDESVRKQLITKKRVTNENVNFSMNYKWITCKCSVEELNNFELFLGFYFLFSFDSITLSCLHCWLLLLCEFDFKFYLNLKQSLDFCLPCSLCLYDIGDFRSTKNSRVCFNCKLIVIIIGINCVWFYLVYLVCMTIEMVAYVCKYINIVVLMRSTVQLTVFMVNGEFYFGFNW